MKKGDGGWNQADSKGLVPCLPGKDSMPWTPETRSAFAKIKESLGSGSESQKREEAVRLAIENGIPLFQIEALLDWLDLVVQSESHVPAPIAPLVPGSTQSPSNPIPESG